ncbi:MAG: oligosaccharide flippase family protein, partial [Pseudomonadota bacterium]
MENKSLLDKSRKSTAFVLPTVMITKIFGILYVLLLTRGLSVEQYGTYNFFIGLIAVFAFLCNFGLQSTLQRFIPKYSVDSQWSRLLKLIIFAHSFRFILSVLFLIVAYVFYQNWAVSFGVESYKDKYVIFALGSFLLFQIMYFSTEFNSLMLHGTTSIIELIMSALKIIIVYYLLMSSSDVYWIFIGELSAYSVAFIFALYSFVLYVYKPIKAYPDQGENVVEFKRLLRFSSFNAVVAPGAIMFSHSMDVFIISAMATQYELGLYALASRASAMIISIMPHNLLQGVIRPVFYHRYSESGDSKDELSLMFQSLFILAACVIFPALMIVGVVSEPLIMHVFGDKYIEAVTVFMVLIVFNVFSVIEMPSDLVLRAIEKVDTILYAQIFAVYNVAVAILLMPGFGLIGVAFATGS